MLIVLWIMSTVERPKSSTEYPVNVFSFIDAWGLSHDYDISFHQLLFKACCLSHEPMNDFLMILGEHGWDGIPLS